MPLIVLLRQLRSQFQTEIQICTILAQGGGASEVTRQFTYMKGCILERHMALAQSYGLQNCKNGLLSIDETELQAKNSALEASLLADLLMIKLTSNLTKA
jgi:DNA polymerase-3 subunit delta